MRLNKTLRNDRLPFRRRDDGHRLRVGDAFEFVRLLLLSSVENEGPKVNLDALGTVKAI